MITIIFTIIGLALGFAAGTYRGSAARDRLEEELEFERRFDQARKPKLTEATVRKRVEATGPVPSDPDVGPFLDLDPGAEIFIGQEKLADALERAAAEEKAAEANAAAPKNEDAAALLRIIAKAGPTAWISKTTANKELGWGFRRYQSALDYLMRNRYIKKIEAKKNRGQKLEVKKGL